MKNFIHLLMFCSVIFLFSCSGNNEAKGQDQTSQVTGSKIEVIDFFSTHRCATCLAIESNAKFTVEHFFPEEVEAGTLIFKTVNVDLKKNLEMAERFEAAGTALFLNVIHDGKEKHVDLTDFAFMYGTEKEKFTEDLKAKIEAELLSMK